ncbi:MAG: M42 family metallopeptidase, partial [Candidatus Bathyarchaeia archaeon]
ACGVAGREEEVKSLVKDLLRPYVDEIKEDKLGNVIGVKWGGENALKVMLAAHMDEIGLLVKTISKEGFIQFAKMGGIDDRILLAQKVIVHTEKGALHGIVGSKPPHIQKEEERKKVMAYDELFIDIGAESQEEAKKMGVKVGDPISFDIKFTRAGKDAVIGKAFDDRVGCAVMIETMKQLENVKCTVYAVGTVQEELGLRGAATAAFGIYPDVGIALDVTVAGDVPGVKEIEAPVKMRKGPSITVADYGLVTHPKVLRLLVDVAEENNIPYQLEAGLQGSTDAARISLTKEGVPSGVISIPTRYIHSPASLVSIKDLNDAVKLTVEAIKRIPKYF